MRKSFLEKEVLPLDEKYHRFGMISLCFEAGFDSTRLPYAAAAAAASAKMNWGFLAVSK